jgi:thiol-disulfide isomerase/thioredoxin
MKHPWTVALVLLAAAALLPAADGDRTVVKLQLNRNVPAWSGYGVDFGGPKDARVIAEPGTTREATVAGVTVRATPSPHEPGSYLLELKSRLGEPVSVTVRPGVPMRVEIQRPYGMLPYRLTLDAKSGPKDSPRESLFWSPDYRVEGTLVIGECRALMAVWDLVPDGVFNRRDFHQGTAVGIDLNGDGELGGKGEFVSGGEVFEFCGRRFFVDPDSLEADGSAVTIVETSLEKPRLGAPVPTLVMETADGRTLHTSDWKGKVMLLDFWASWCGYCIEGFPVLKEMQESHAPNLQVISINTDEPSAIAAARKVVASHDMPWEQVMSGKGLDDPLWMIFQGLDHSMPQYVIIDREGIVRYSGGGGENLTELRAAIEKYTGKP